MITKISIFAPLQILAITAAGNLSLLSQTVKASPEGVMHLESTNKKILNRSVTLDILQNLITDAEIKTRERAAKYATENPGKGSFISDRVVLFDACMGSDQYEHDQIAEGSILCLLGISRDAAELPFAKVYFEGNDGKSFELVKLATLPEESAKALRTDGSLGTHISAALYWIPRVRSLAGQLLLDFQVNRTRFRPGVDFPFSKNFGRGLKDKNPKELTVNFGTMKEIIDPEYPGMVLTPEILGTIESLGRSR